MSIALKNEIEGLKARVEALELIIKQLVAKPSTLTLPEKRKGG